MQNFLGGTLNVFVIDVNSEIIHSYKEYVSFRQIFQFVADIVLTKAVPIAGPRLKVVVLNRI